MPERIEWRSGRLRSVRDLTPDIRLFEIEPAGELVVPTPGSHINVAVQIGDRPDLRSYSMVGPCDDGLYRIAVKLLPDTRGGSAYMWSLAPGARLTISTPGNHFELGRGRPEYLLLAGGIGITPIYTMTLALAQAQANFRLLYACRRRQDVAFGDELRERIGDRLQVFLDEEGEKVDLAAEIARARARRRVLRVRPDRNARGRQERVAAERTPRRQAAVRDVRQQRPLRIRTLQRQDPEARPASSRSPRTRPCWTRWRPPGST